MINYKRTKKKLIVSYKNLSDDLKLLFKENYPEGYKEYIQKITKPNGEPLFVVPMETDDTSYLIRFDLKVDTLQAEDLEKEMFDSDDKGGDDDFNPMVEAMEKDEDMGGNHTERVLNHGSYEGVMDEMTGDKKKKSASPELDELRNELKAEFDDEDDDEYKDDYSDEGEEDEDDDFEPSAEDLAELEKDFLGEEEAKPAKGKAKSTAKKPAAAKSSAATKKATTAKKPAAKAATATSKAKAASTKKTAPKK